MSTHHHRRERERERERGGGRERERTPSTISLALGPEWDMCLGSAPPPCCGTMSQAGWHLHQKPLPVMLPNETSKPDIASISCLQRRPVEGGGMGGSVRNFSKKDLTAFVRTALLSKDWHLLTKPRLIYASRHTFGSTSLSKAFLAVRSFLVNSLHHPT